MAVREQTHPKDKFQSEGQSHIAGRPFLEEGSVLAKAQKSASSVHSCWRLGLGVGGKERVGLLGKGALTCP